jgi:MoaA/NifB/PqqE/SkfB family radical SAM enzyme
MDLLRLLKRANALLGDLEALAGASRMHAVPVHVEVDPTSQCNLRCPMCHQSKLAMGRFRLSAADLDVLIDRLPYVDSLMIAGLGEPLLSPQLEPLLVQAARFGCRTHVFTNGQLIHRRLGALRRVDRISVSFDGATRETFETLRRGASFQRVVDNIRLLRAAAPRAKLVTSTVVSRVNLHEVAAIAALAHGLGMDEVHLAPVDHTPDMMLQPEHAEAFQQQLATARAASALSGLVIENAITPAHFRVDRNSAVSTHDQARSVPQPGRPRIARPGDAASAAAAPPQARAARRAIHHRRALAQRLEIARRLVVHALHCARLLAILKLGRRRAALPWCSAPWKYGFARSRADARLCPYADVSVGTQREAFGGGYNTPLLERVRASLAARAPLLDVCRTCTDDHRRFGADGMTHLLRRLSGGRRASSTRWRAFDRAVARCQRFLRKKMRQTM